MDYRPELSVKKNAELNGVSEATVRKYIKDNKIDRRFENKLKKYNDISNIHRKHPEWSARTIARTLGLSPSTVGIYLYNDVVKPDDGKVSFIKQISKKTVVDEHLSAIPVELAWVAKQDVSKLRSFLLDNTQIPYITCGMGGAYSACVYSSLLYGTYNGLGRAVTCYNLNSISDETLLNCKVLINSAAGRNDDVVQVADRLLHLNHPKAANFTIFDNPNNKVKGKIAKLNPEYSINLQGNDLIKGKGAFVNINEAISAFSLYYKAFTGKTDFLNLDFNKTYTYRSNAGKTKVPPLNQIKHFVVLYGSYGEPVAYDFESKIVESGFASVQLADYRNFTHGRFSFVGNNVCTAKTVRKNGDMAVLMLVSPREKETVKDYREIADEGKFKNSNQVLPDWTPIITIETEHDSPLASIDLLYQLTKLYLDISHSRGTKNVEKPVCKNIDKRTPRGKVRFKGEFKKYGALQAIIDEPNKDVVTSEKSIQNKVYGENTPIDFMRIEEYDGSETGIVAFSNGSYKYNGHSIGFSNMRSFPIDFMGYTFNSVETAYIACAYGLNYKKNIHIQKEIQAYTNALLCKRQYRNTEIERKYGRKDFHESSWHFNLMLYLVWLKCMKYPEFRDMLLAIPDSTAIVESQNGFKKVKVGDWGCKNPEALEAYKERLTELKNGGKATIRMKETATIETWNIGKWTGMNHQGKILMACRAALRTGTEPNIDYQALNDADIYLFGIKLTFNKKHETNSCLSKKEDTTKNKLLGAIIGDIAGSIYEQHAKNVYSYDKVLLFPPKSSTKYTDDTVLTIAVAHYLLDNEKLSINGLAEVVHHYATKYPLPIFNGRKFMGFMYGKNFQKWIYNPKPYKGESNGSAIRVSSVGWLCDSVKQVLDVAKFTADISHNSEAGEKGAQAIALCVFLARTGKTKRQIKSAVKKWIGYDLSKNCDTLRKETKKYVEKRGHISAECVDTVPHAITAFLESKDYEDAIRLAISIGGDSDSIANMCGAIAVAYYKEIPEWLIEKAMKKLSKNDDFIGVIKRTDESVPRQYTIIDSSYTYVKKSNPTNANLLKARSKKNDEYFTPMGEISDELQHYTKHFYGKTILCNCDNPDTSNFTKYFVEHYKELGLKKLISIGFSPSDRGLLYTYDGNKAKRKLLKGNGDFRNEECLKYLKKSDVIVTNPPFSLFDEYVEQLLAYEKQFLIVGNKNAITYNVVMTAIRNNKIWSGCRSFKGDMWFTTSTDELVNVAACWFTNLDHEKRHIPMELTKKYNEKDYPKYDNYDAIDVGKVKNIPYDYGGTMGVPITFINQFCPEQFTIVGVLNGDDGKNLQINEMKKYYRVLIKPISKNPETKERGKKTNTTETSKKLAN